MIYVHDDVIYVYDDVTYVYDDVTHSEKSEPWEIYCIKTGKEDFWEWVPAALPLSQSAGRAGSSSTCVCVCVCVCV